MLWHIGSRRLGMIAGTLLLVASLILASGCSESTPRPRAHRAERVVHPPAKLGADQQRVLLNGLAVTLTTTSSPPADVRRSMLPPLGIPLKAGYRPLYIEVEALNTTDSTITIGNQSWPVIRDATGTVINDWLGYGGSLASTGGPYWGHGGRTPGKPRNNDFAPGGMLTLRIPQQVPPKADGLNLSWSLDASRVATFAIRDF